MAAGKAYGFMMGNAVAQAVYFFKGIKDVVVIIPECGRAGWFLRENAKQCFSKYAVLITGKEITPEAKVHLREDVGMMIGVGKCLQAFLNAGAGFPAVWVIEHAIGGNGIAEPVCTALRGIMIIYGIAERYFKTGNEGEKFLG